MLYKIVINIIVSADKIKHTIYEFLPSCKIKASPKCAKILIINIIYFVISFEAIRRTGDITLAKGIAERKTPTVDKIKYIVTAELINTPTIGDKREIYPK